MLQKGTPTVSILSRPAKQLECQEEEANSDSALLDNSMQPHSLLSADCWKTCEEWKSDCQFALVRLVT